MNGTRVVLGNEKGQVDSPTSYYCYARIDWSDDGTKYTPAFLVKIPQDMLRSPRYPGMTAQVDIVKGEISLVDERKKKMKWEDVTRQQLARMEADEMDKSKRKRRALSVDMWFLVLLLCMIAVMFHMYNTGACSLWKAFPLKDVPARCLVEMMAHG